MEAHKVAISTPSAPAAIGPYSQAVRVGNLIFTSGQIPLDSATGAIVAGGIREQTAQVLENLSAILQSTGLDFSHVVKTTVFLKEMKDFPAMNAVYTDYFDFEDSCFPARSTVQVASLPKDSLIEIECVAQYPVLIDATVAAR
jgi:2-iminobutanoate/2-iminopropanoate deaminase